MSRAVGVAERLAAGLEPAEPLLALATQLGDIWFLSVLAVWLYWFGDSTSLTGWRRRHGLVVLAAALWAFAITYALKGVLALPRPPGAGTAVWSFPGLLGTVYADTATATGYGFPSGHATGAAAVYGALGLFGIVNGSGGGWRAIPRRLSPRTWAAAGLIGLVALTRLGLGVHYLVDVLAGAAVGIAVAAVCVRLAARPGLVLGLATITAVLGLAVAGIDLTSVALVGATGGGLAAWWLVRPLDADRDGPVPGTLTAVLLAGSACLAGGVALALGGLATASSGLGALGTGLLVVALPAVALPAIGLPAAWRGGEK